MSDPNKNTGAPTSSTTITPTTADPRPAQPATDAGKKDATKAPDLEQGRPHTTNVNAQKEAADARRTSEQVRVPTATSDVVEKSDETNDREEDEDVNAERTVDEGQSDRKPGSEPAKPVASSDSNGKS